ncbi:MULTISPECIES: hypothetical protein [Halorussus]|uniref:hypothetical protein n=1 Tax=Halorussus TaxID=1070314 RepID=UPI00209DD07D|nr:hypothetical protein [Halorussus vallis]USZ78713.1 hypothetical protein NGM07_24695 [Halorussus vallis]
MSQQVNKHATEEQTDDGDDGDNDGPDWKVVAAGGGIGFAIGGPVGAAAGAAISAWFDQQSVDDSDDLSDHHRALLRAAREVNTIADEQGGRSASLYMAHIDGSDYGVDAEEGGTRNVLDAIEGDPDLIYSDVGGPTGNMIVEVETAEAFETQTEHTLDQLERYRLGGYRTVLAVPESDLSAAEKFVEEHDVREPVYIVAASNLASLL